MNVSFEPVGTMGNNQSLKVRAWAYDASNGMLLNGKWHYHDLHQRIRASHHFRQHGYNKLNRIWGCGNKSNRIWTWLCTGHSNGNLYFRRI